MLEISGVTAGYGDTTVLHDLSLSVPRGSVAALLGPNGAGKTTLLRAVTGHIPIKTGSLHLNGEDVTRLRPHDLAARGVCHISEGRAVFPSLTVRENLLAFTKRGNERDTLAKAADAFPILGKRLKQRAGTMSGGEQQMLALVRAWVQNPTLIIVDEPSLGLAPKIIEAVFAFLQRLAAEQGCTMIVVEQYVDMALHLADSVHVIVHGEVVHTAPAADVDRQSLADYYVGTRQDSHDPSHSLLTKTRS